MSDKKISQLTAATTPLVGTEVLPIVQSGSTVKVANNDLRPKQIQSNATSGVLQVTGPAAASTRVMTTPDANFTVARTDATNTFTGTQNFSNLLSANSASASVSFQNYQTQTWNLSTSITENTQYQRFKITLGNSASGLAKIKVNTFPQFGIPWSNVTEAWYQLYKNGGTVTAKLLSVVTYGSGGLLCPPVVSGNDVVFGLSGSNNGTATSISTDVSIELFSRYAPYFTFAEITGTTAHAGTPLVNTTQLAQNDVTVNDGNLIIGTSGKGIDFSATANSSGTMTSELLADYEEGTWTPTYTGSVSNPTITYELQNGTYTKVGRQVTCVCRVSTAAISGGSGNLQISGLPYVPATGIHYPGYMSYVSWWGNYPLSCIILSGGTVINLVKRAAINGTDSWSQVGDLTIGNGYNYSYVTITYFV